MLSKGLQITLHRKNSCLNFFGTIFHRKKPYIMLSLELQTTLCKKNLFSQEKSRLNFLRTTLHKLTKNTLCHVVQETPDNAPWEKTLCNVVQEAPDNIAHEKILFNVVILLGQHCTGKNLCSVVQEIADNIAQEKTQCNVV